MIVGSSVTGASNILGQDMSPAAVDLRECTLHSLSFPVKSTHYLARDIQVWV